MITLFITLLGICSEAWSHTGPHDSQKTKIARPINGAPLFKHLGSYRFQISSKSAVTKKYFSQGMMLAYGFNHKEALRSFKAAQTADPKCAICYWGESLVLGPNINKKMPKEDNETALRALNSAKKYLATATPLERDLITSLETRYHKNKEREALDNAYAKSMKKLTQKYPKNANLHALYAEALMDINPWKTWTKTGKPIKNTLEVIRSLDKALKLKPQHPLALHLYIHAWEASKTPEKAENAADKLANLAPDAGHLVHMPAHIYLRLGRYRDAMEANIKASQSDESYITQCRTQGYYPLSYYPHNIHFLWYAATLMGEKKTAHESAEKLVRLIDRKQVPKDSSLQRLFATNFLSYARFKDWNKILETPAPKNMFPFESFQIAYTKTLAHIRKGQLKTAIENLERLKKFREKKPLIKFKKSWPMGETLEDIFMLVLNAELSLARGNSLLAIKLFKKAIKKEDSLPYMEPPHWYFPIRQRFGNVLLEIGKEKQAKEVFLTDLKQHPRNIWSVAGLNKISSRKR